MRAIILSLLLLVGAVQADDDWDVYSNHADNAPAAYEPWQLTFGLSYRTDARDYVDQDLTTEVGLLHFITPSLAFALRTSWTPHARSTNAGPGQDITIFGGNLSFRVQDPNARITPFAEAGYDLKHYSGDLATGYGWKSYNGGFSFGGGVAVRLSPRYGVDLSFRQIIDHNRYTEFVYGPAEVLPFDGQYFISYLNQNFYNATHIQLHLRVAL